MELREILEQREKSYGDFTINASFAQQIKGVYLRAHRWPLVAPYICEALHQIASKISRILSGGWTHVDTWRDIAGYATLVADQLEKNNAEVESETGLSD